MSLLLDVLADVLENELPDVPVDTRRRVLAELCHRIGGEKHYVPRRIPGERAARVRAALADGDTLLDAAKAGEVSPRHARRLRGTSSSTSSSA